MAVPTRPRSPGTRAVLVMLALALLVTFGAGPARAAPNSGRAPRYYLALGDSLSRGVQPDPGGQNHPTDQGYADDLAAVGRLVLPQLQLVKLGCETEETTASMLGLVPSKCPYDQQDQLAEAEAFLRAHRGATVLVTIDIGANDLSRCINRATGTIDLACVQATFQQAPANLATILARLRAAAGPRVPIVGMNFYDPFLAAWLQGPAGQALARLSVQLVTQYNDLLEAAYQGAPGCRWLMSRPPSRPPTSPTWSPCPPSGRCRSTWPASVSGAGCAHRHPRGPTSTADPKATGSWPAPLWPRWSRRTASTTVRWPATGLFMMVSPDHHDAGP